MNPNSQNQRWSEWVITIRKMRKRPNFETVKLNAAKFGRKVFGSASQMNVIQRAFSWEIKVRTEGHPVHDPEYVERVKALWTRWSVEGFGLAEVTVTARLLAGSRQDGSPTDQLIVIPPLRVEAPRG